MFIKVLDNKNEFTDLEVTVDYDRGGINCFTYKEEPRGYYVSVTPVKRGGMFIEYTAFSGVKKLVEECKRLNRKRLATLESDALTLANDLITYICNKYNLTIEEGDN